MNLSLASQNFRVFIDPGHGGADRGATYENSVESKLVLSLAAKLEDHLKKETHLTPILSRETDVSLSLHERVQKAQSEQAHLFVSLHANATQDVKARGMEIFFIQQKKDQKDTSQSSTEEILGDLKRYGRAKLSLHLSQIVRQQWKGNIKQSSFYVLAKNQLPSVLVEIGFLSNPKERKKLESEAYQKLIVQRLAKSLVKYLDDHNKINQVHSEHHSLD